MRQHWLGAVRWQAIAWVNVGPDLCRHMATPEYSDELQYIVFDYTSLQFGRKICVHYDDVIMDTIASLITSLTIVYSTVYSDADQRKHQSSASLAFVWGIHRGPVNSPHKWPVTQKMFPFDDVIMCLVWCDGWLALIDCLLIFQLHECLSHFAYHRIINCCVPYHHWHRHRI